ncbi:MAG: hypothetical protein ACLP50_00370 [Solirubrobacteraceae bacterium]
MAVSVDKKSASVPTRYGGAGVVGGRLDQAKVSDDVGRSLMLVTALSPQIVGDPRRDLARLEPATGREES